MYSQLLPIGCHLRQSMFPTESPMSLSSNFSMLGLGKSNHAERPKLGKPSLSMEIWTEEDPLNVIKDVEVTII